MIRMMPEKRTTASRLVSELSRLNERCRLGGDYATRRTKVSPPRAGTDLSSLVGNNAGPTACATCSNGEHTAEEGTLRSPSEPVREGEVARRSWSRAGEDSRPAALREESTLVETGDPNTDLDDEQSRENDGFRDNVDHRIVTPRDVSVRSKDMTETNDGKPDPEREPLLRRSSQDSEILMAQSTTWQTFCGCTSC